MRFAPILLALLVLGTLALPAAGAVDLCRYYGVCLPPVTTGCGVDEHFVAVTLPTNGCAASVTLRVCTARYFGGGGGGPADNFVWYCDEVATLP